MTTRREWFDSTMAERYLETRDLRTLLPVRANRAQRF